MHTKNIIYTLLLRGLAKETSKCSGSHAGGDDDAAAAASVAASVRRLYNIYIHMRAGYVRMRMSTGCGRGERGQGESSSFISGSPWRARAGGLVVGVRTRVARGVGEGRRRPRGQQHNRLLMIREEIDLCYKTVI